MGAGSGKNATHGRGWPLLAACAITLLSVASVEAADERPIATLDRWNTALEYFERGEYAAALPILEDIAIRPMRDAQLMAGTMHWLGQGTPANRERGYALVKLAVDAGQPGAAAQQRKMVESMSGQELIAADRYIADYQSSMDAFQRRQLAMAVELLGLVVDPKAVGTGSTHCAGRIPSLDAKASAIGGVARVVRPEFPPGVVLADRRASIKIALYVARDGSICKSVALERSRRPDLDDAAVYGSKIWMLNPAKLNGQPVEAMHIMNVEFRR